MKSLIKDESGVAYLLLVLVGFYLIIVGITYNFTMDFTNSMLSSITTGYSYDSKFSMDSDTAYGLNLLFAVLINIPIILLTGRIYYAWNKAQKPEQGY